MNRGKTVIVTMVLVSLGLAIFAWWHRWSHSREVLKHWGKEASVLIRNGTLVELLRLHPQSSESVETLRIAGEPYAAEVTDISSAPGLIHARHHLLHEKGFLWDQPRDEGQASRWTVALRFREGDATATLAFDFAAKRARLLEKDAEVSMEPIAPALRTFVEELMPNAAADPPASPANSQGQLRRQVPQHGPTPRFRPRAA